MTIQWTKDLPVSHERGIFKILVSKHGDTTYYASLLYYEKKAAKMRFELHTEFGASDQEAIDKIKSWIDQELPGNYSVGAPSPRMKPMGITVRLG
jgi:hypothetical protein